MSKLRLVMILTVLAVVLLPTANQEALAAKSIVQTISVEWRRDVWLPPDLRTMDQNGGNMFTVAGNLVRGGNPRWSPDGLRIGGYQKQIGQVQWDRAIMTIRKDGSAEQVILTSAVFDQFNAARGLKSAAARAMACHSALLPGAPTASSWCSRVW